MKKGLVAILNELEVSPKDMSLIVKEVVKLHKENRTKHYLKYCVGTDNYYREIVYEALENLSCDPNYKVNMDGRMNK